MNEIERSDGIAIGVCGQFLVVHYLTAPTVENTQTIERVTAQTPSLRTEKLAVIVVVDGGTRPPEPAARTALREWVRSSEPNTLGLAYVIRASGFSGATARAIISGMTLFNRPKYPLKVFARVCDAVIWLDSKVNPKTRSDLNALVQEVERFCTPATAESNAPQRARKP